MRDNVAAGSFDVSGLQPGSMLKTSSKNYGDNEYRIDQRGKIDGRVGFINGSGQPEVLTITGIASDGSVVNGTLTIK